MLPFSVFVAGAVTIGLLAHLVENRPEGPVRKGGVMAIVLQVGAVQAGDVIATVVDDKLALELGVGAGARQLFHDYFCKGTSQIGITSTS